MLHKIFFKLLIISTTLSLAVSNLSVIASEPQTLISESAASSSASQSYAISLERPQAYVAINSIKTLNINSIRIARGTLQSSPQWQILKLTNKNRAANNLWPLTMNDDFQYLADSRSNELISLFSHTRPDGRDCFSIFNDFDIMYNAAGENIAARQTSSTQVMNSWLNSEGHRSNILSTSYTHLGAGRTNNGYNNYWTQLFLNDNCSPTITSLVSDLNGAGYYRIGTPIDDMSLILTVHCDSHGDSYIPVILEMCNNFNVSKTGLQELSIGYNGHGVKVPIIMHPFNDVGNDWYTEGIANAYLLGYMTGLNENTFGVYSTLYRAQFATILYRMDGSPAVNDSPGFPDVPDSIWYSSPVTWASANKIVTGYSNTGLFGPNDSITREQIAVMLKRFADYKSFDTSLRGNLDRFKDTSSVSSFAIDAMSWAVGNGIISGTSDNCLNPQGQASRAECSIMLTRFAQKYNL